MERRTMFKALVAVGFTGLLAAGVFALDNKDTPPCCQKKDQPQAGAAKEKPRTKMRCTLTGKVVDECCCEQRDGKTYCPLAGKTVDSCCCEPVADETERK